jgi:hypothetical protein
LPELIAVLRRCRTGELIAIVGDEEGVGPELEPGAGSALGPGTWTRTVFSMLARMTFACAWRRPFRRTTSLRRSVNSSMKIAAEDRVIRRIALRGSATEGVAIGRADLVPESGRIALQPVQGKLTIYEYSGHTIFG